MQTLKQVDIWSKYDKNVPKNTDIQKFIAKYGNMHFLVNFVPENSKVLDIGCGTGYFLDKLKKEKNCKIIGIDIIKDALKIAQKIIMLDSVIADCNHLPFKEDTFDTIVSFGLFEHFKDPVNLLNKWSKCLKPGGLHICAVPNKYGHFGISTLKKNIYELVHGRWIWGWEYRYTPKELKNIFSKNGYEVNYVLTSNISPILWYRTGISKYPKFLRKGTLRFYVFLEKKFMKTPFGYHLIIIAKKKGDNNV